MPAESLAGLEPEDIFRLIEPHGFTAAHAETVATGMYRKRIADPYSMPQLPKDLRKLLKETCNTGVFPPEASAVSSDGTIKYLFTSPGGRSFETVVIPEKKRRTVCVSVQSGCRMGCSFCVTASYGFHGNLTAGEIVNQVLSVSGSDSVTHVVLMGMGEPMDNPDEVLKACRIMTAGWGLALSPRNITVSTVGITPSIERFIKESDCNLTLSLFSPFSEERRRMVPAENAYPVSTIIGLLKSYPLRKKRRISLAYVMIKGLNDSEEHLEALRNLVAGTSLRINLLPYHANGSDGMLSSDHEKMLEFKHKLVTSGTEASIRQSRGADISAACGLLASDLKDRH